MTLIEIIRTFKRGVALALALVLIEKLAWIVEPTVFGRLLDALIAAFESKQKVSYAIPLTLWIAVFVINSGVGALRRALDPRIYLNMFSRIAVHVAESCRRKGADFSKAAVRTELSREYVSFLQRRVPDFVEQIFDLGGTVIALAFYDARISITCLCAVVPLAFIGRLYNSRIVRLQKELHDQKEGLFEVFGKTNLQQVREYYERLAKPQISIANWGSFNFAILRLFLMAIFLVVLYIAIDLDDFTTGKIYSIVAYLWTFITSTEYLPDLLESYASLKDIQDRLRTETAAARDSEED